MTEYPVLAIDYGQKHFGISISDSKGIIASPLDTISKTKNKTTEIVISEILNICQEYKVKTILLGSPQIFEESQKGTEKKIVRFKNLLSTMIVLPIILWDESFSTRTAQNMLTSSGQSTKKTKGKINSIAATVFLQEFLNSKTAK